MLLHGIVSNGNSFPVLGLYILVKSTVMLFLFSQRMIKSRYKTKCDFKMAILHYQLAVLGENIIFLQ